MPTLLNYKSVPDLIDAITNFDCTKGKGQRPDDPFLVKSCPVMLKRKGSAAGKYDVYLVRTDWKDMTWFKRFSASIAALFGRAPAHRLKLSEKAAMNYRVAMNLRPEGSMGLRALCPPVKATASASLGGKDQGRMEGKAKVAAIIEGFRPRMQAIRQLSSAVVNGNIVVKDAPAAGSAPVVPDAPERHEPNNARFLGSGRAAMYMHRTLLQDIDAACKTTNLSSAQRLEVLRGLGFPDSLDRAAKLKLSRLHELNYDLDAIPTRKAELARCREIALGDLHGNCLLLLHTLVNAGFVDIRNQQCWENVCKQLNGLESEAPDWNWQTFQTNLRKAIKLADGARQRKLTLQGDVLADRLHCDMFMTIILAQMDAMGLDYDHIFGNHDGEFMSYVLGNRDRPNDEPYSVQNIGVRLTPDAGRSLFRLNDLLNGQPGARDALLKLLDDRVIKHMKLATTSRDGLISFHHAFVNRALMAEMGELASNAKSLYGAKAITDKLNRWLTTILQDKDAFAEHYHVRPERPDDLKTLRAMAWNVPMDPYKEAWEMARPRSAATEIPIPGTAVALHGHCSAGGPLIRAQLARHGEVVDSLSLLKAKLNADTPLAERFEALRKVLGGLHSGSDYKLAQLAGNFLAFMLRSAPELAPIVASLDPNGKTGSANDADESTDLGELGKMFSSREMGPDFAQLLCGVLERIGREVASSSDGASAMAARSTGPFRLEGVSEDVLGKVFGGINELLQVPVQGLSGSLGMSMGNTIQEANGRLSNIKNAIAQNLPQSKTVSSNKPSRNTSSRSAPRRAVAPRPTAETLTPAQLEAYLSQLDRYFRSMDSDQGSSPSHRQFTREICAIP